MGDISWKGGFMSASSIRVIPVLQMSACRQEEEGGGGGGGKEGE